MMFKILSYVKNILHVGEVPKLENNYQARNFWINKKCRIRVFFAFSIIIFNLFGLELSTPHYSLTTEIANIALNNISSISNYFDKSEVINKTVSKNLLSNEGSNFDRKELREDLKKIEFGQTLKIIGYGTFVLIFLFAFVNADPFSNINLLLDIIEGNNYKKWKKLPNIKEVEAYANIAPSNKLYFKCKECIHLDYCENSLVHNRYKRNEIWAKIFIDLDVAFVSGSLRHLNELRKWHFLKYSLLYSSFFLILVYLGVRLSEFYLTNLTLIFNGQLLLLIGLSLSFFFILNAIDPSLKQLKAFLEMFYDSSKFLKQFKEKACEREEVKDFYDPVRRQKNKKGRAKKIF